MNPDKNKTAAIAGMYNEISRKVTAGLLEKGWHVYLISSDIPADEHERLSVFHADFTQVETLTAAREQILTETDVVDLLVCSIDYRPSDTPCDITTGLLYDEIQKTYDINALGVLRVVNSFYDLLANSVMKRIGVITTLDGSNYTSRQTDNYAYAMSRAALNMQLNILFNRLRPNGYTFRLYATDDHEQEYGDYIVDYFTRGRSVEPNDPKHTEENRLTLRDGLGREYPW